MGKMKWLLGGLALAMSLASAQSLAGTVTIDFERFPGPDGILGTADDVAAPATPIYPLRDEYASLGLRFSAATIGNAAFFDGNPSNHFLTSTQPVGQFTVPVYGISIDSNSFWNATLTAFDAMGQVLATSTLVNPQAGRAFLFGELSLATSAPIASFSVTAPQANYILNLDNLSFTVAEVPEPQDAALFSLGLGALALGLRRRGRRHRGA